MKLIWNNVWRSKAVTLTAAAAVMALTAFLLLYANSIRLYQAGLAEAYDHLEVRGWVEGIRQGRTPVLTQKEYALLLDSGFVDASAASIFRLVDAATHLYGIQDPASVSGLSAELPYITWMEGYDAGLFRSGQPVCLAHRDSWLELGEQVSFPLKNDSEQTIALTVVGLYGLQFSDRRTQVYYCPLEALRSAYQEAGLSFSYSGLDMTFRRLDRLEQFKADMLEADLHIGEARLRIDDALMQQTTGQLKHQIALLQSMLPVLLLLVAAIGCGLSFLLLRGRKKEAAILRSLGVKRGRVFALLLAENGLQALAGAAAGLGLTAAMAGLPALRLSYVGALLLCYLLGGGVAVWRLSGVNVFTIMAAGE